MKRKSPQEKKELEYTKDHFTFGWESSRVFPKTWKRKKACVNRQYRRKSQELLAELKPGVQSEDAQLVADDLTATHFQKSVTRKRLHKSGTLTLGEKVQRKQETRAASVGHVARGKQDYDERAARAVRVLSVLQGKKLNEAASHLELLRAGSFKERVRIVRSKDPVDHALYFIHCASLGFAYELNAPQRNAKLAEALDAWLRKANNIIEQAQCSMEKRAKHSRLKRSRRLEK